MQHFVKKFVSNLQQVSGFLRALRFPPLIKLTRHGIAEILLKVALNTITHSQSCLIIHMYSINYIIFLSFNIISYIV
jgi:hypothetical protein